MSRRRLVFWLIEWRRKGRDSRRDPGQVAPALSEPIFCASQCSEKHIIGNQMITVVFPDLSLLATTEETR